MKLLIFNASPKKRGGASQFFSGILRLFLPSLVKKTVPLRSRKDFDHALSQLGSADAVCISFPLYVDGLPSHLAEFLSLAEEYCKARSLRFRLYAIANNGFIEGQQNRTALRILESWCLHSGAVWSGGIGIGGGVMLRGAGNRLSCFDRAIYRTDRRFVSYGRKRTAGHALYPRHSGGKLAVFQFRCIVLPGPVVCGRIQAQNRKEPLHPCAASILPVCSDCRSVYDSILSVLRPVPVRTFKTGRLFS